jgi:FkbM family methyltransferase
MANELEAGFCHSSGEQIALLDRVLAALTANKRRTQWMIPFVRAYMRYWPLPIGKRQLWLRVIDPYFAWRSNAFVATTLFGARIEGNSRDILQQYIYYFGIWEPHLTHFVRQRLRAGDTFIDVGANVGYYSLLASRLVCASGTVVAIDASPRIFATLLKNLRRNGATNVRTVNVAVSDRTGIVRLFEGPDTNRGLTTIVEGEGLRYGCRFECEIPSAPLSAILSAREIQTARLIKIDVEGAEWSVVAELAKLLPQTRDDLECIVEIDPARLARDRRCPEDVLALFRNAGFYPYQLQNNYSATSYLDRSVTISPYRLTTTIDHEMDLLFSRQDSDLI